MKIDYRFSKEEYCVVASLENYTLKSYIDGHYAVTDKAGISIESIDSDSLSAREYDKKAIAFCEKYGVDKAKLVEVARENRDFIIVAQEEAGIR